MVPALLDYAEPLWLKLKRVPGWPYLNDLQDLNPSSLGSTLAQFHLATYQDGTCLCHVDNQPANILFDGSLYHFLDFSDSRRDLPESDLTHLLLFWASELPYQIFVNQASDFLVAYDATLPIARNRWLDGYNRSISSFDTRRLQHGKSLSKLGAANLAANRAWLSMPFDLISPHLGL